MAARPAPWPKQGSPNGSPTRAGCPCRRCAPPHPPRRTAPVLALALVMVPHCRQLLCFRRHRALRRALHLLARQPSRMARERRWFRQGQTHVDRLWLM